MKYTKDNIIGLIFRSVNTDYTIKRILANKKVDIWKNGSHYTNYTDLTYVLCFINNGTWKVIKEAELQYEIY